jgi:hypothetical protein
MLFCLNNLSCNGQNEDKNAQTPVSGNVKDSTRTTVPYWKLPYEKQLEIAEPYHVYGKYKLRWQGGKSYYYEEKQDSFLLKIKEDYPGILVYQRIPAEHTHTTLNTVSLEFYEIGSKKLESLVDLEKITPYNSSKYKNIEIGSIDYEYDKIPGSNSDCTWPGLPSPDIYRTYNSVYSINPNGYVCVGFILVKVHTHTHYIVGWEQTFTILNPNGKEIYRSTLNYDTPFPYISPDGKYLVYSIGSETSANPFEPCQKAIEIHDIQTRKRIYEYKCDINQDIMRIMG